ncbi:MAG: WYL domain-containing protein [Bacteroidales bacterium]|nr:WYL domain-containing protein [Bacteroidales bacterium]
MLRLMQFLTGNVNYTLDEICERLDLSRRTMFRYLDTFKSAGFSVQRIGEGRYRLATLRRSDVDLSKIVYFTEEEAYVVNRLIDSLDNTNAMKQGLRRKLAAVYDSTDIGNYIDKKENSVNIGFLADAIREGRKVVLRNYSSSHTNATKDYTVEPFKFNTNYIDIWAFDTSDGLNKRFKIARIGSVEILDEPWDNADRHKEEPMDSFRIHGNSPEHVKLRLHLIAKNLLLEEYPLAEKEVYQDDSGTWYYEGDVRGMDGVGRFVLGLPAFVNVIEGDSLKAFLKEQVSLSMEKFVV